MMILELCDICKERMPMEKYKIKIKKRYVCYMEMTPFWNEVCLCKECQDEIIELIKNRSKNKKNGESNE